MTDTPDTRLPPPPIATGNKRRLWMVIGSAIVAGILLLIVVIKIDRNTQQDPNTRDTSTQTQRLGPGQLEDEELEQATDSPTNPNDFNVQIDGRAWIDVADPDAPERRAQRYRFDGLTPSPEGYGPGWLSMINPQMEIFLSGDRLLAITGDSALVNAPNNVLEQGDITGNVLIELFENIPDGLLDRDVHRPVFIVQSHEASFDNFLGEVRCAGELLVETDTMFFPGRDLRMQINDQEEKFNVRIATVDYIRLATGDGMQDDAAVAPRSAASTGRQNESAPRIAASPEASTRTPAPRRPAATPSRKADAPDNVRYYRLTLHDNIRIEQGDGDTGKQVTGQRIEVLFSTESQTIPTNTAYDPDPRRPIRHASPPGGGLPVSSPITALGMLTPAMVLQDDHPALRGRLCPPPMDDDIFLHCDGGLSIHPLEEDDPVERPPADDMRMDLFGAPVQMRDFATGTDASCDRIRYHGNDDMIELLSSEQFPLRVNGPDIDIVGQRFWVRQRTGDGALEGAGTLRTTLRAGADDADREPDLAGPTTDQDDRLEVKWNQRVALTFHQQSAAGEQRGMNMSFNLGDLASATFFGHVEARSDDLNVDAAQLGIEMPPGAMDSGRIDAITARCDVRVQSITQDGTMTCQDLRLELQPDDAGDMLPRHLLANGRVNLRDAQQHIRAEHLDVVLRPRTLAAVAGPDLEAEPTDAPMPIGADRVEIETLLARDDVDIRLADGARVLGDRLWLDENQQELELTGRNVQIAGDTMLADRGRRVIVRRNDGYAQWTGDGRARIFTEPLGNNLAQLPDTDLTLTWMEGADFALITDDQPQPGASTDVRLREAVFNGGVDVRGPDFWLDADRLSLLFPTNPDDAADRDDLAAQIESMRAVGNVYVVAQRNEGTLACGDLELTLTQSTDGRAIPQRMIARENVVAVDPDQTVWADHLETIFKTNRAYDEAGDEIDQIVQRVLATGDVQVAINSGGRAYADQLIGIPDSQTVELNGREVLVVSDALLIDRGTRVILSGEDETATWIGSGRTRVLDEPVEPLGEGRRPRPVVAEDASTQVIVTFNDAMTWDNTFNEGTGALSFRGGVEALATPNIYERNTMTGDELTLQFIAASDDADAAPFSITTGERDDVAELRGGSRALDTLLAKGNAKLESRTWQYEDHRDTPSVFYIAGDEVRYHDARMEAEVLGRGVLLIRNPNRDEAKLEETEIRQQRAQQQLPFSSVGLTRFRWTQSLQLSRAGDDRFDIVLEGNVIAEHQAIDEELSTIQAQRLEAVIRQSENPDEADVPAERQGAITLGGRMELRRVAAFEHVNVRTPTRDVTCGAFDYNLLTYIAEISGSPRQRASVLTRGTARPVRAQHVVWNMKRDTIVITKGSGAGAP
jgi:hypothetical protein